MKTIIAIILTLLLSKSFGQEVKLVSTKLNKYYNVRDFCILYEEIYFTIQSPNQELSQIVLVKNEKWENPILLPFCDGYSYLEPFLSTDGKRLYFASDRPLDEKSTVKKDFDIWYVERKIKNSDWSKPVNLGTPVNSENDEFYPTLADNGNLYFTMEAKSGLGKDDIYYSKWDGSKYSKPILLDNNINSEGYEFNAFISKDEDFIIYTQYNSKDGFGSGDLYISRKNEKEEWSPAKNLGNIINTKYMEYCPFYDYNTNTLYFTSKRAKLIPQKFKNIKQYLETLTGSENGLSKIYIYKLKL